MRKLTEIQRAKATGLADSGWSNTRIAQHMGVCKRTIARNNSRVRETGGYKDRPRSGRPRATTPREDRRVTSIALRTRFTTVKKITTSVNNARVGNQRVSQATVRRRLHAAGIRGRKPAKRIILRDHHKRARLAWATTHSRWTLSQWTNVLFTDESRFSLYHSHGRIHV
mgnify:CR=1 FL=1